jgi:uncharacterized Ntn-hydrolase superfamily protein
VKAVQARVTVGGYDSKLPAADSVSRVSSEQNLQRFLRGKQSASLLVVKAGAGFNGGSDRAIDIRVDDHTEPFLELGRLLDYAEMNYTWNRA